MHVLLLTVFVSLVLVLFFLTLFLRERSVGKMTNSAEREALLPLEDDSGDGDAAELANGEKKEGLDEERCVPQK